MINPSEISQALKPVTSTLDRLGVPYYIGGSIASSAYGLARSTLDVDMISNLTTRHIDELVSSLKGQYYISREQVEDAINRTSSFNLIHLETGLKIDIFIGKNRPYDRAVSQRIREETLTDNSEAPKFYIASPEDVVLAKLQWFKLGDCSSEKQWNDIVGVLRVQEKVLDMKYLQKWAKELKILDLLEKVLTERYL